jgi:hypothetical protein
MTPHSRILTGRSPSRSGLILLLLSCVAAVFISVGISAVANNQVDEVPLIAAASDAAPAVTDNQNDEESFKGTVSGTIPADMGPPVPGTGGCVFSFTVPNSGNSNVLGNFTGSANFVPNLCDGSYTGTFNWVAANGDRITGPFRGQLIPTATAGVYLNMETSVITGGTGRYRHATGMFTLYGVINFNTGTFVLPWQGTIDRH